MKLDSSNIVLVGGFNPHIIQPGWLGRHGVVKCDVSAVPTEIRFVGADPHMMGFELDGWHWEVSPNRVLVGSSRMASPEAWLLRLIELLPHTPLQAVGINFKLVGSVDDLPAGPPAIPNQHEAEDLIGRVVGSTAQVTSFMEDDARLRINVSCIDNTVTLDANFHREISIPEDHSDFEPVREAMRKFNDDWQRLSRVVKAMTGKDPDYE